MSGETAYSSFESEISNDEQSILPVDEVVVGVQHTSPLHDELLDKEWLVLITMAKELGLSREEIRAFLRTANREALPASEKAV